MVQVWWNEEAPWAEPVASPDLEEVGRTVDCLDAVPRRRSICADRQEGERADRNAVIGFERGHDRCLGKFGRLTHRMGMLLLRPDLGADVPDDLLRRPGSRDRDGPIWLFQVEELAFDEPLRHVVAASIGQP